MQSRFNRAWELAAYVLATGFGAGLAPKMPGTVGSLWGPPLAWCLQEFVAPLGVRVLVVAAVVLAGIPVCGRIVKATGNPDPQHVVYDEIAAMLLVFLLLEFCGIRVGLVTGLIGFVWFRVFDITKPWPIRKLESLPGGLGVMADDVAAAVFAAAATWLTVRWLIP